MARGPIVNASVEALIATVHQEHPKWKAPEVQREVSHILHDRNPQLPPNWPGLSIVQKTLAAVRKSERNPSPLDEPWSTTSLAKYPFPPEALPSVLRAWIWVREHRNTILTIREAQWAARLYAALEDIPVLTTLAVGLALAERMEEITGKPIVSEFTDLTIYQCMTREVVTPERQEKILGVPEWNRANWEFLGRIEEEWEAKRER